MNKYYITFGQIHTYSVKGITFNKDCLAEITGETCNEAHTKAMKIFNGKFHNCHTEDKLEEIIKYFPNIFIACIIFIFMVFLVDFSQKVVIGNLEKEKITYSRFLGRIFRWSIWILTILAILYQLRIVPILILSIFIGVIAMIVITLGISFGLGGKDLAAKILKELEDKFK